MKDLSCETNEEFRQLADKHHELEDRLHELTAKHYLSDPEQVEEVTLKKRKLQLKDRMEDICAITVRSPVARASPPGAGRLIAAATAPWAPPARLSSPGRRNNPSAAVRSAHGIPFIAGWPFVLGLLVAVALGSWPALAVPSLVLAAFFLFFFRDPDRARPDDRDAGGVAGRWPRDGRRAAQPGPAPRRGVAADQHVSVADGRPRQPHPASRAGHAGRVSARGDSCRPIGRRPASSTSGPRSGSITTAQPIVVPADRRHPGAAHRLPRRRPGDQCEPGERFGIMKFGSRIDVFLPPSTPRSSVEGRRRRSRGGRNGHRGATLRALSAVQAMTQTCGSRQPVQLRRDRRSPARASGAASRCCRACSRSATCSAATRASSTRCAANSTTAAPFIGFAVVLDMLDGRIARMTGTTSEFGVQLDSLADVDLVRHGAGGARVSVGTGAARPTRLGRGLSVRDRRRACVWRASTSRRDDGDKRYFVGMPSPAAAGVPPRRSSHIPRDCKTTRGAARRW